MNWLIMGSYTCSYLVFNLYQTDALFCIFQTAHIFFDDAFEAHTDKEYDFKVNSFVKELIKTVRVSARYVNRNT